MTALLSVSDLVKHFRPRSRRSRRRDGAVVHAVCGVSFDLFEGETLALVGESGCGKSTLARCVLQLAAPTNGSVRLEGVELTSLDPEGMRRARKSIQAVFQDPYGSLDPRMTVHSAIAEPLRIHGSWSGGGDAAIEEVTRLVGLSASHGGRYPHELSGGERQRVGIARSLVLAPKTLVLDEPVSALDASVRAGIVNLLIHLQESLGLSYLFIAHDLSLVRHVATRVAVMYMGKIVETAPAAELYRRPMHPYTQALLSAVPVPDPHVERSRRRIVLEGEVPSPTRPPSGCRFRSRCWKAQALCETEEPALVQSGDHSVACHFPEIRAVL